MNVKNMSGVSEMKPAGIGQKLTVDGVKEFSPFDEPANKVLVSVDTHPVRVRFDGTAPDGTTGNLLPAGYVELWSRDLSEAAKFINTTAGTGLVFGSPVA